MLQVKRRAAPGSEPQCSLTLPFDRRQKSRLRARLDAPFDASEEVGIELERGTSLSDGDLLLTDTGHVVLVRAAREPVSIVRSSDAHRLLRVAYHLGNRHVALQIAPGELRYLHDHVLDDMVRSLGLEVSFGELPFEPESGAYGSGHSHLTHPHGDGGHSHGHHGGHDH
jgi:urease accessory protein